MKIIRFLSKLVLLIALLNLFAYSIYHVNDGGKRLGFLTEPIKMFSRFPQTVVNVFKNSHTLPGHIKINKDFQSINKLKYDIYALHSYYDNSVWKFHLKNLRNDSLIFEWILKSDEFKQSRSLFSHSLPLQPILLEDTSIVIVQDKSPNLYRLDKYSNIIWHNTSYRYHHAINLDSQNNVWVCSHGGNYSPYYDDSITKIDIHTGKVLFHKPILDILSDNDLIYFIYGMGYSMDPLHLNDIQPILVDGKYWKKGDIFLSFRHKSLIILYRPLTNKVLRVIQGPFFHQHDVDIQSDSTISFFNNNMSGLADVIEDNSKYPSINKVSEVLSYNFKDSSFTSLFPDYFESEKIYTHTQGLHEILSNGDLFVESSDSGKVYVLNNKGVMYKNTLTPIHNNFVQKVHWTRIYENLDFLEK